LRRYNLIVTGLALIAYAWTNLHFDLLHNIDSLLFWARDAQTYRDWILLRPFEVSRVPFFYPVVLAISQLFGNVGTWLLQVCMWVVSVNLIAATVYRKTGRESYAVLAGIAFISSMTLQLLTAHALTETLVVLLLSLLIYFWQRLNDKFFMIIFSILAVTKPVFLFPLFAWLIMNRRDKRVFIAPAIALSIQMLIAVSVTGAFIPYAESGFRLYFVAKVLMALGFGGLDQCRQIAVTIPAWDMIKLLAVNLHVTMNTYYNLIAYNMTAVSGFVPDSWKHFSFIYTTIYSMVGAVVLLRARSSFILWMTVYLVAVTGTMFGQGDRYIITLMPLVIYLAFDRRMK
jgi:hypothetical protein